MTGNGRALLATLTLIVVLSLGATGSGHAATITRLPSPGDALEVAAGADGLLWALEQTSSSSAFAVARFDAEHLVTRTPLPVGLAPHATNGILHALPDGSMALLAGHTLSLSGKQERLGYALVRLAAGSGAVVSVRELPQVPLGTGGLTIAPDGAVWFARSCRDEVDRIARDGAVTRVRLGRRGCGAEAITSEPGARLAFDPTGALWLVNLCQGRIARISPTRRVRAWRTLRLPCGDVERGVGAPTIAPDPSGGIAFFVEPEDVSGRIGQGRLEWFLTVGTGTFTNDGTLWRRDRGALVGRRPDGSTRTIPIPPPSGLRLLSPPVLARGETVVAIDAEFSKTLFGDSHVPSRDLFLNPQLDVYGSGGLQASYKLPASGPEELWTTTPFHDPVVAPDGAIWPAGELFRVLPDDVPALREPAVRVRPRTTRAGAVLWVELACDADRGRFCLGSASLANGGSAAARSFAIAGQQSGGVPLRLSARVLRVLRRHRTLAATVVTGTTDGGVARRTVRIRR